MKLDKKKYFKFFFINLLLFFIVFFIFYKLYNWYINIDISNTSSYAPSRVSFSTDYTETVEKYSQKSITVSKMLEESTQSVVGISRLKETGGSIFNNISSDELGLGTGIIVTDNGYILSNSHVTGEKYSSCFVSIDELTYNGTVVWSDSDLDLSIVKIYASNLLSATLGDSNSIKLGENVFVIGNPIGYDFRKTVTSGIISALNRTIKLNEDDENYYISNLIQTDASINPGNSGGPLLNSKGEVIGITSVKISSAEGIGFAIPINVVKNVITSFKESNEFQEATLGIYAYDGNIAKYLKLKNKVSKGIYISNISINGPCYKSNLKVGDLIIKIDNFELNSINELRQYIYSKKPNDCITLTIERNDTIFDTTVILEKKN